MATQSGVIPLIVSNVNWTNFLKDIAELTGRSPIRGLDASNIKLGDYARFITSLGEFQNGKNLDPLTTIREKEYLLRHLFFGFLIFGATSSIFKIMEVTDLNILTARMKEGGRVAVVTGTLKQWKDATLACVKPYEVRWILNQCLGYFRQLGLGIIWDDCRKQGLKDGTYLLEYKE